MHQRSPTPLAPRPGLLTLVGLLGLACSGAPSPTDAGSADSTLAPDAAGPDAPAQDAVADGSPGDAPSDAPQAPHPDLVAYCELRSRAVCAWRFQCRRTTTPAEVCLPRERAECLSSSVRSLQAPLSTGRARYDAAAAMACFSAPVDAYCRNNTEGAGSPQCARIFVGTVPLGMPCTAEFGAGTFDTCADGYCPASCPATCQAFAGESMPCEMPGPFARSRCAPGFSCVMGTCRALGARGQPCGDGRPGCGPFLVCRGGLALPQVCGELGLPNEPCDGATDCLSLLCVDRRCQNRVMQGRLCSASYQCPVGHGCYDTKAGGVFVGECQPDLALGAACDAERSRCGPGLLCMAGRCVVGEPVAGQPCREGVCANGLWCRAGTCSNPSPVGGPCDPTNTYQSCAQPAFCPADGTCRLGGGAGTTCRFGFSLSCAVGFFCGMDDRCAPRAAAGAACVAGPGSCVDGQSCQAGRCAPLLAQDAPCTTPEQCSGGICYEGRCTGPCTR